MLPSTAYAQQSGTSSSAHPPRLHHRKPAADQPADDPPDPGPTQESSSADTAEPQPLTVTDADERASAAIPAASREAVTVTARDLDIHLNTTTGAAEVRAQLTLTNSSSQPLTTLPVRISGALQWESARIPGESSLLKLEQHHLRDDLDHTGIATELALPIALQPGASVKVDLFYGGTLTANQTRLRNLHAPDAVAIRTDWDTVTPAFTGLRGLGNVEWYPVTGPAALLANPVAVPQVVEASRTREANSSFRLRLTVEHQGPPPDAAFLLGNRATFAPAAEGFSTAEWTVTHLGPHTPSLFLTDSAPQTAAGGLLRVVTDQADRAASIGEAAAALRPLMQQWLGPTPAGPLDVLDLSIPDAAGFSDGALLVAPLRNADPTAMAPSLIVPLANAWLPRNIAAPWLRDGIPEFLQALWAERSAGRDAALAGLNAQAKSQQPASATASSSSSDDTATDAPQTPLARCTDAPCARVRAAYALEMLRTSLGDNGLQAVLSGWTAAQFAAQSREPQTAANETATFERLAQQVALPKKLDWFFADWLHGTGTLPQLTIVAVAPRKIERGKAPENLLPQRQQPVAGPIGAEPVAPPDDPRNTWGGDKDIPAAGSWLIAVEVQNAGGTGVDVPVTVRNGTLSNTLPLHIPAHGKATIRIPFEAEPEEVQVNDGTVPEANVTVHRRRIASK